VEARAAVRIGNGDVADDGVELEGAARDADARRAGLVGVAGDDAVADGAARLPEAGAFLREVVLAVALDEAAVHRAARYVCARTSIAGLGAVVGVYPAVGDKSSSDIEADAVGAVDFP
jgi:hypothetical protein